jgi:hypothetical protein
MVSGTSTRTHFRHLTHAGNLLMLITVTAITFTGSAETFSDRVATSYGSDSHIEPRQALTAEADDDGTRREPTPAYASREHRHLAEPVNLNEAPSGGFY